jgi:hypothetical protein
MGESEELERLRRLVVARYGKSGVAAACMGQEGAVRPQPGDDDEEDDTREVAGVRVVRQSAEVQGNTEANAQAGTPRLREALEELRRSMARRKEEVLKRVLQQRVAGTESRQKLPKGGTEKRDIKRAVEVSEGEGNRMYPEQMAQQGEKGPEASGTADRYRSESEGPARARAYFETPGSEDDEEEVRSTTSEGTDRQRKRGCSGARGGDTERCHSADEAQGGRRHQHRSTGQREIKGRYDAGRKASVRERNAKGHGEPG